MTFRYPDSHPLCHAKLKDKQRSVRDTFAMPLTLRVHRALSWYGRAEKVEGDEDVRFILLWIGFNALYAADIGRAVEGQGQGIGERTRYQGFFHAMTDMDREGRLYDSLWQRYSQEIRVLLDNRYVFNPFWQHHNGAPGYDNWQDRFMAAKQAGAKALASRDGASLLSIIFDRLYVLRNQLVHGGATWNSDVNRAQVSDGAAILACLLPIFIDLMMDAPERDWDMPHYPVVED